mgnify:CR=1 FL=1
MGTHGNDRACDSRILLVPQLGPPGNPPGLDTVEHIQRPNPRKMLIPSHVLASSMHNIYITLVVYILCAYSMYFCMIVTSSGQPAT